jgi:hypothetical protein
MLVVRSAAGSANAFGFMIMPVFSANSTGSCAPVPGCSPMTTVSASGAVISVISLSDCTLAPPERDRIRSRFAFTAAASIFEPSAKVASGRRVRLRLLPSGAYSHSVASIGCTSPPGPSRVSRS